MTASNSPSGPTASQGCFSVKRKTKPEPEPHSKKRRDGVYICMEGCSISFMHMTYDIHRDFSVYVLWFRSQRGTGSKMILCL